MSGLLGKNLRETSAPLLVFPASAYTVERIATELPKGEHLKKGDWAMASMTRIVACEAHGLVDCSAAGCAPCVLAVSQSDRLVTLDDLVAAIQFVA